MNELIGAELDAAVGRALGLDVDIDGTHCIRNLPYDPICGAGDFVGYSPSTDWSQGGPIIERERIDIQFISELCWAASPGCAAVKGPTPLIAAMRAFAASKA